jgi:hypothetical protein
MGTTDTWRAAAVEYRMAAQAAASWAAFVSCLTHEHAAQGGMMSSRRITPHQLTWPRAPHAYGLLMLVGTTPGAHT